MNNETRSNGQASSIVQRKGARFTLALLMGSVVLMAASPAVTAAIAARKANYKEIGGAFKSITDEVRSGSPDMSTVRPLAKDIAARSALQLKHFPKGSGPESKLKTRAKALIWKEMPAFTKLQRDMITSANALSAAANAGDKAALSAARAKLGETCKSCHDRYRAES